MENTQAATKTTKRKTASKALKIIVAIVLMIAIAFAAALIIHKTDRSVPASAQAGSLSAYDLAVQNGYTGDLEQWLMSLAGETGPEERSANPHMNWRSRTATPAVSKNGSVL